jgi:M6 family metalloprotease-like protein
VRVKIKNSALIVAFTLILSLFLPTSNSAQKITAGATCKTLNKKTIYQNKTYTCIKKGTKLVWNKGVAVKTPTPTPTPTLTPTPTPIQANTEFEGISVRATGETTAELTFRAKGYLSYQVFVVVLGGINPKEISRTAVTNFSERTAKLSLSGLECGRSNFYEVNVVIFSGKDGTGSSISSGVKIESTGKCEGQTTNPSPTPSARPTNPADNLQSQPCTKENERIKNSVNEFWCRKDPYGRLIWTENYRFSNPIPRAKLPEIKYDINQYFEPKMPSAPIENCKIKEKSDQGALRGDLASGFPYMPRFQSYPKNYKMALIPIDFSDFEGDKGFRSRVNNQMQLMSDWYKDVSGGRLTIDWVVSDEWIRLPGSINDYYVEFSGKYPDTENFWKKVIPVIDSKFDLTGVQTINFLLPLNQQYIYETVQSFSFLSEMKKYNSTKTKIYSFAAAGIVFEAPDTDLWEYWAHEFGHEIGLAHVGASRGQVEPIMQMELLGDHDGPYRELGGWMRFIIGWLSDSQVYCQETAGFTSNEISLVPLPESKAGIKTVVIPTGVDSAIVIDSRRPTKYGCPVENLPGGVLVYTYDAKLGNQSYFIKAHYPDGRQPTIRCEVRTTYPDILLHTGDSVVVNGYKISVISSGTFDQIRITKN